MKVNDLMTTDVASINDNESLSDAARVMWEWDCGAVPVLQTETGRLIGMITDRDICIAVWSKNRLPSDIRVSEVISPEVHACREGDSIASAEQLMRSKQIRRVPVIDAKGKLAGILTLADIAKASQGRAKDASPGELAATEVASTLVSICSPRPNPGVGASI